MSAATPTPGPWELRASSGTVDFGIIATDRLAQGGWVVIAEVFSELRHAGERSPQALPNARAMAASQDLLAALVALRRAELEDRTSDDNIIALREQADAAIAKATGTAA